MANRRVTTLDDPLVELNIRVRTSQLKLLQSRPGPVSESVREAIDIMCSSQDSELTKLKIEATEHEARWRGALAQIEKIEAQNAKKNESASFRENIIKKQISTYANQLIDNGGFLKEIESGMKFIVGQINKKYSGSGFEPITYDELRNGVIEEVTAKGKRIYYN